jgi:hypothetical protein
MDRAKADVPTPMAISIISPPTTPLKFSEAFGCGQIIPFGSSCLLVAEKR